MRNIFSLNYREAKSVVKGLGYPEFQADNLFRWLYLKRVKNFDEMTDLPKGFRSFLWKNFKISYPRIIEKFSAPDGTTKYLFELEDRNKVESVLIPEKKHMTFCISSQVGCRMGCKFCATAQSGLARNLKFYEITGQVLSLLERAEGKVNIVFMGMGEPLDNINEVERSIEMINKWMNISLKRITLSTVCLIDGLERILKKFPNIKIAISLNFPEEKDRTKFMPINRKYPISLIIKKLKELPIKRRERVTIEYVLMDRINDSLKDAEKLGKLLRGLRVKINLIPYNENEFLPWKRPSLKQVEAFASFLRKMNYSVFIRFSKGNEIKAACGQLRAKRG